VNYSLPPGPSATPPDYDPNNPWRATNGSPEQAARRRRTNLRTLKIFGAVIVAFLAFVVLLGVLGSPAPAPIVVPPPAPSAAAPLAPIPTLPPPPAPARPANAFTAGSYDVGNGSGQIAPGRYHTEGSGSCYFARLRNTDGEVSSIITNSMVQGPTTINVKSTDAAFEIKGDCTFTKVG
jgi:hypothetical protein